MGSTMITYKRRRWWWAAEIKRWGDGYAAMAGLPPIQRVVLRART